MPPSPMTDHPISPVVDGGGGAFSGDVTMAPEPPDVTVLTQVDEPEVLLAGFPFEAPERGQDHRARTVARDAAKSSSTVTNYDHAAGVNLDDLMTPYTPAMPSVVTVNALAVQTADTRGPGPAGAAVKLTATKVIPAVGPTVMRPRVVGAGATSAA